MALFGAESALERLTRLGLCALAFTMPWDELVVIPGFGSCSKLIGVAVLSVGTLALVERGKGVAFTRSIQLLLSLFFWIALSGLWSPSPSIAAERIFTYAQDFVLVAFLLRFIRTPAARFQLMQTFVLGSVLLAATVGYNYTQGTQYVYENDSARYSASSFSNGVGFDPNDVAMLLAIALPIVMQMLFHRRYPRALMVAIMGFFILAIGVTGSRGGSMAMALSIILTPIVAFSSRQNVIRFAIGFAVGLCTLAAVVQVLPENWWNRMSTIQREISTGSMSHRRQIWEAGLAVFGEHKLAGIGIGGFATATSPLLGRPRWAHNVFLSIATETGLIGLTLFASFLAIVIRNLIRSKAPDRAVLLVMLAVWWVGAMDLCWEYRKSTWFVLGLLACVAVPIRRRQHYRYEKAYVPFSVVDHAGNPESIANEPHAIQIVDTLKSL